MITFCEDCDNVESSTRSRNPNSWICLKFPRKDGHGFVSETWWSRNEPYMRCVGINGGACPLFKPIKTQE
jgi:hypothetical protein